MNPMQPALAATPARARSDVDPRPSAKVLIVEDDTGLNLALRLRLESAGYQVLWAYDADEALAQVQYELPDIILMDVGLPGMNGLTATRVLVSSLRTSGVPVLFITGDQRPHIRHFALEAGVKDVLYKPFDNQELVRRIDECLHP